MVLLVMSVVSGATWHVKSDGTGNRSQGNSWATAINADTLKAVLEGVVAAGDTIYIRTGLTAPAAINSSTRDGSLTLPVAIVGVKASTTHEGSAIVLSDWAIDSIDKPVINMATYVFTAGDYYILNGLHFSGSANAMITTGIYCSVYSCVFNQSYNTISTRYALSAGANNSVTKCDFYSEKNGGISPSNYLLVAYCRFNRLLSTSSSAITSAGTGTVVIGSEFIRCRTGIAGGTAGSWKIINNTFFACSTAISGTTGSGWVVANNIFDSTKTKALLWTTKTNSNFYIGNHGNSTRNTAMWDGVDSTGLFSDQYQTSGDPLFAEASADSFAVGAGSPCRNSGIGVEK